MAYAAYREMLAATLVHLQIEAHRRQVPRAGHWFVLDVTVHSCDALRVRRSLATSPEICILRCIPLTDEKRVRLEVRLSEQQFDGVVHCIICCVPDGEIGHMISWNGYLRRHGLAQEVDQNLTHAYGNRHGH